MSTVSSANRVRPNVALSRQNRNDGNLYLQLGVAVRQLLYGSEVASRRNGLRGLDRYRYMDAISDQKVMPSFLLLKAASTAWVLAIAIYALFENVTSWGTIVSGFVAATFAFMAVLVKEWFEKKRQDRVEQKEEHRTDAQSLLTREKLADDRITNLFAQIEKVHSEQIKSFQSQVALTKELYEQERALVNDLQKLASQQAATIQQLMGRS